MRFILLLALCLGLVEECVAQADPITNQQKGECTQCSCANDLSTIILQQCKPSNCTAKCYCLDRNDIGQQGSCSQSTQPSPSPSPSPPTCDCASQKAYRDEDTKCRASGGLLWLLQDSQSYVTCGSTCQAECRTLEEFPELTPPKIIEEFGICGRVDFPCECNT